MKRKVIENFHINLFNMGKVISSILKNSWFVLLLFCTLIIINTQKNTQRVLLFMIDLTLDFIIFLQKAIPVKTMEEIRNKTSNAPINNPFYLRRALIIKVLTIFQSCIFLSVFVGGVPE